MKEEYDFSKGKRGAIEPAPPGKTRITIRLDNDILDWFRHEVDVMGGGNYQTLINDALREYVGQKKVPIEEILRRVVREELSNYKGWCQSQPWPKHWNAVRVKSGSKST
jgi:BrnA antitoxin of type II toxin-antitoxin system